MAGKLGERGVRVTPKEVRVKINNLTQKYRAEKKKLVTGAAPSDWKLYEQINNIIGAYTCNAAIAEDSLNDYCSYDSLFDEFDDQSSTSAGADMSTCTTLTSFPCTSTASTSANSPSSSAMVPEKQDKSSKMNIQKELLKQFQKTDNAFLEEMEKIRKISERVANLDERLVEGTLKFQDDFMNFVKNKK